MIRNIIGNSRASELYYACAPFLVSGEGVAALPVVSCNPNVIE